MKYDKPGSSFVIFTFPPVII